MTLFVPLGDVVERHKQWAQSDKPRVPLGFREVIDDRTDGGPAPGDLVLFVARSGVGKTIVACNVAVHAITHRIPTVFFSLEMDAGRIVQRIAAIHDDVPTRDIELDLKHNQDTRLDSLVARYSRFLTVIDRPGLKLSEMTLAIEEAAEAWGYRPRLAIIDYLELVTGAVSMDGANDGVTKIARKMKDWCRREEMVGLCLHQLNMASDKHEDKGHTPVIKRDIKYGVDVPADYVLAAYRPEMYLHNGLDEDFRIQLLKTRADGGLEQFGVRYHLDPASLKVSSLLYDRPKPKTTGLF